MPPQYCWPCAYIRTCPPYRSPFTPHADSKACMKHPERVLMSASNLHSPLWGLEGYEWEPQRTTMETLRESSINS